jgi:DNA-binding NarL/FixJ family response regulator
MTPDAKIKILIADDHAIVCKGIEQILSTTPDLAVMDFAHTGEELLEKARQSAWDLILLDISMPGISGIPLLKQLKKEHRKLPVVMLSVYPEDRYGVEFLRSGASAYLNKTSPPDQLIETIRKVAGGEIVVSPHLAQKIALDAIQTQSPLHHPLTTREHQVMLMLASGNTVSGIGKELGLSVKTVSTHRSNILKKMNMANNNQLINYCIKNHLID